MKIKKLSALNCLKGKTVLMRVDYNVALDIRGSQTKIKEDFKIAASLRTIRWLKRYGCRIILISHLGEDPLKAKGAKKVYSLKPVSTVLSRLLGDKVGFISDTVGKDAKKAAKELKPGKVLLLENLRFNKGEKENSRKFAKELSDLALPGGIFVNEAFSVCHREHSSVSAINDFMECYAGFFLEEELENLDKALHPKKPAVAVIGGAKISTKLKLIKSLERKYDNILIGGAMANNIFKSMGCQVGVSLINEEDVRIAAKLRGRKIVIPEDVIVKNSKGNPEMKSADMVLKDDRILDIGPRTVKRYAGIIKTAETIVWNGPMGMFEDPDYRTGTFSIASAFASRSRGKAFGVIGGGETVEALNMSGMSSHVDWVSSGGGAMLAYLGREEMPGLKGIFKK